jgi:hypothetical protein
MQEVRIPIVDDLGVFALIAKGFAMQPLANGAVDKRDRRPGPSAAESEPPRRGWLDRLDRWFWEREPRAREAYLATSTDIYELEVRIRNLERGRPWRDL